METKRPTHPAAEEILGGYFPVLDHGFVSLVDYMGSDEDVEAAARVSYGHGTRRRSRTRGLIRYLRRHRHTTPSEMVELKFHCCMPIFVARQWVRHRTANINEYSARYSLLPLLFYTPDEADFALQSTANRQGRDADADPDVYREAVRRWRELRAGSGDLYEWLLEEDVARELARIDLPASVYTQWYWKIDLHNLCHFLSLRCDAHAQYEIRAYAEVMAGMLKRVAPLSYEAWIDYEFAGAHLSLGERRALARLLETGEEGEVRVASGGASLDEEALGELGLSGREIREFRAKLDVGDRPDFELDLDAMKEPSWFEEKMQEAVPEVDRE